MAPKPRPVKRSDGTIRWRVQFRERPGATPTSEVFDSRDAAARFIDVGEEIGYAEARRIRHGTTTDYRVPTLAGWFETWLTLAAASSTPGTVDDNRRMAARTWLPVLGRYPLDMISREMVVAWGTSSTLASNSSNSIRPSAKPWERRSWTASRSTCDGRRRFMAPF